MPTAASRQVGQNFVDAEIFRFAECAFTPLPSVRQPRPSEVKVFAVAVQPGVHTILNHPGAELTRRFLLHHPVEDPLHAIRAPQIQIVADHFFEEVPAAQGTVEDLRQALLHLPDRQVPRILARQCSSRLRETFPKSVRATTGEATGLPNCSRMNTMKLSPVANLPIYAFR